MFRYFILALALLFVTPGFSDEPDDFILYWGKCTKAYAVDGDTIDCVDLILPFKAGLRKERLRFSGVNAPESFGKNKEPAGFAAKYWLGNLVNGKDLYVRSEPARDGESKKGSFGRFLVHFYLTAEDALADRSLNKALVENGHAVYKKY